MNLHPSEFIAKTPTQEPIRISGYNTVTGTVVASKTTSSCLSMS